MPHHRTAREKVSVAIALVLAGGCGAEFGIPRTDAPDPGVANAPPQAESNPADPSLPDFLTALDEVAGAYSQTAPQTRQRAAAPATYTDPNDPGACTDGDWLTKYLWYRIRLRGDGSEQFPGFVSMGAEAGESLAASLRDPAAYCEWDYFLNSIGCTNVTGRGSYSWGDSTIVLGWHIAVAATEYRVLSDLGYDTTETIEDLYLLLEAFNRLDEAAEVPYGATPTRDGFFLRADVPQTFATLDDGSPRFPHPDPNSNGYRGMEAASCHAYTIEDGSFVSQDQVIGMIYGLAFVEKLIPDSVSHQGVGLRHEAQAIVHRMVMHLRDNGWKVKDPDGNTPPGEWGGNAISFSNQLAKAANRICGDTFGIDDYRDSLSKTVGAAAFTALDGSWSAQTGINKGMALKIAAVTNVWSASKMTQRAAADHAEAFALTHALLNDTSVGGDIDLWQLESILGSAPCTGPCNDTDGCANAPGWRGPSRWQNPENRNGNANRMSAEYNGLDYMLLHNAYFLYKNGDVPTGPVPTNVPCSTLADLVYLGPTAGAVYDRTAGCSQFDADFTFCGRRFSTWLDASRTGEVKVYLGPYRWSCTGSLCTLSNQGSTGSSGADLILGTIGSDSLSGGNGNDCLYGFLGDDLLEGDQGRDELHGGLGNDSVYGEKSGLVLTGDDDELYGDAGSDLMHGGPGADQIYGHGGNDHIWGDPGDDAIDGGEGADLIYGDAGDDLCYGGAGSDEIHGDSGADRLVGGPGRNKLDGDSGSDILWGGSGEDFLKGGAGSDTLWGGAGADRLCGNDGDDVLWGGANTNTGCRGGWGNDEEHECSYGLSYWMCTGGAFNDW